MKNPKTLLNLGRTSAWLAPLAACVLVAFGPARNARAVLLNYSFSMTAASGSFVNLGMGPIDLSGVAFSITGMTTSDTDVYAGGIVGDGIGEFAAMSVFDFGMIGSFATDASSGHYYFQDYGTPSSVSGAGLADLILGFGFAGIFSPAVAGDPDFGIPLGTPMVTSIAFANPWVIGNLSGQILSLNFDGTSVSSMTVTAKGPSVPEGGSTLALLLIALPGLVAAKKLYSPSFRLR